MGNERLWEFGYGGFAKLLWVPSHLLVDGAWGWQLNEKVREEEAEENRGCLTGAWGAAGFLTGGAVYSDKNRLRRSRKHRVSPLICEYHNPKKPLTGPPPKSVAPLKPPPFTHSPLSAGTQTTNHRRNPCPNTKPDHPTPDELLLSHFDCLEEEPAMEYLRCAQGADSWACGDVYGNDVWFGERN
nr:hypothetical protein Iba_chr03cCG6790 [Ipomoea batatas]